MKRLISYLTFLVSALLLCSCQAAQNQDQTPVAPESDDILVSFTESTSHVTNPERGFYSALDIRPSDSALSKSRVMSIRSEGRTLMYLGFYLTNFMNGDISQAFLDKMQSCFDALRDGGAKCILRFAYQSSEGSKPWDPSQEIVLRHVEQLKPLLIKNKDVIFVLQAGFVGVWGEWYYTQNFIMNPRSDADYIPRKNLIDALMAALPQERQIEVRTPQFKMRMYGLSLKDTLTQATAHDGSLKSRLGGHNDCFGASQEDYGTFDNESGDRAFWKADSRYTIMGGETCNVSEYCTCDASRKDMNDYHWTYLNIDYNGQVLSRWRNSGCFDEIVDRLGYRLVLDEVYHSADAQPGKEYRIVLNLENKGWAAPMNPRNANIVFIDNNGNQTSFPLGSDPRTWHPGKHQIGVKFNLPSAEGTFYLDLSDPLLPNRPEYSIALANKDVFSSKTGLNKLFEL